MRCERLALPNGAVAIVCTRGQRRPRCSCGGYSKYQCDFPLRGKVAGRTCSRHLCGACVRAQPGGELDYCDAHHRKAQADREREELRTLELAPEHTPTEQLGLDLGGR
jgi:hypothetical protein